MPTSSGTGAGGACQSTLIWVRSGRSSASRSSISSRVSFRSSVMAPSLLGLRRHHRDADLARRHDRPRVADEAHLGALGQRLALLLLELLRTEVLPLLLG